MHSADDSDRAIKAAGGGYMFDRNEKNPNVYCEGKYDTLAGAVLGMSKCGLKEMTKDIKAA